jgi:hypothetical protein
VAGAAGGGDEALQATRARVTPKRARFMAQTKTARRERRQALAREAKRATMRRMELPESTRTELEAAAFRRLVAHLRERTDVQNLDLMNLAGFCRNCLSKWYRAAADERGVSLSDPEAREIVYGMPYDAWKAKYQK